MKKILMLSMLCAIGVLLVGCNVQKDKEKKQASDDNRKYVAMVTDVGGVDDKSFNEGCWNGVKEFADKNGYKRDFVRPVVDLEEARAEAIDEAVASGADVIVCVGSLYGEVLYDKQYEYEDVEILFVDGEPKDSKGNIVYNNNLNSIIFKEEECGYLAGYVSVKEGYNKLGFLGGMDIPAVRRFGYGFVQGAESAAKELKIKDVEMEYMYTGGFVPTEKITNDVKKWYANGTEIVFSCGAGILYSVIEATDEYENKKIIGVDVDQSEESEDIIFSAMKGLAQSISNALEAYEDNNCKWPKERAGKVIKVGVKEDGVGLSATESGWKLKNTSIEQYNEMIESMKQTELTISE